MLAPALIGLFVFLVIVTAAFRAILKDAKKHQNPNDPNHIGLSG